MNEKEIVAMLESISAELHVLDEKREKLLSAHKGLEALLTLVPTNGNRPLFVLPDPPAPSQKPKGLRSMRGAIIAVLQENPGTPLHTNEILSRARKLGANTAAKDPQAIIDLVLYSLARSGKPVSKVAPRTWAWSA